MSTAPRHRLLALAIASALTPLSALANPQGGIVIRGDASISGGAGQTVIDQRSDKAVINWQKFSIQRGEVTRFKQPRSQSIALNRVTGAEVSKIQGSLKANGNVWLVNQNGIVIGQDAVIDAHGFVATTSDIADDDFMAGNYHFSKPSSVAGAKVVNQGTVRIGEHRLAALVAPHARNEGVIKGRLGKVVIGAAETYTLDLYGDGLIAFDTGAKVSQEPPDGHALAENTGTIAVDGGTVLITANAASDLVGRAVHAGGSVMATSVTEHNGRIVLDGGAGAVDVTGQIAADGELGGSVDIAGGRVNVTQGARVSASGRGGGGEVRVRSRAAANPDDDLPTVEIAGELIAGVLGPAAEGASGGRVDVRGERVLVAEHARIDVSGAFGGGEVLLGGDQRGEGPGPNSAGVVVLSGAEVLADGGTLGDGGRIIVFGEELARVHGRLSAQGGSEGGDGGFVETSAHGWLDIGVAPELGAAAGAGGEWLIDPHNITIGIFGANSGLADGPGTFTAQADNAELDVDLLRNAFGETGTVRVETGASGTNQPGNITLKDTFNFFEGGGSTTTMILDAAGDILLLADIVELDPTPVDSLNLELTAGGNIRVAANIALNSGNFLASANGFDGSGGSIDANAVDISTGTGGVVLPETNSTSSAEGFFVASNGSITSDGALTVTGTADVSITSDDAAVEIRLDAPGSQFGALFAQSSNTAGDARGPGDITIVETGTMNPSIATDGAVTLEADQLALTASSILGASDLSLKANSAGISLPGVNLTGDLIVQANGNIDQFDNLTIAGNASFTSTGGTIDLPGFVEFSNNQFGGSVGLNTDAGQQATLVATSNLILGTSNVGGDLNLGATGNIAQSGPALVGGTLNLITQGGEITLDDAGNDFQGGVGGNTQGTGLPSNIGGGGGSISPGSLVGGTAVGDVTINDANGIDLDSLVVDGNLSVTAGGAITDSGTLTVAGNGLFETQVVGGAPITLDSAGSTFGSFSAKALQSAGGALADGDITVANGTALAVESIRTAGNLDATASSIAVSTAASLIEAFDARLESTVGSVDLPQTNLGGTLEVVSTGSLRQGGPLDITGTSTISAGATGDAVLLTDPANRFGGAVALTTVAGGNAALDSAGAVDLAAGTVLGNLTVKAAGAISDSGTLLVAGGATFITQDASDNGFAIKLDETASSFGSLSAETFDAGSNLVAGDIEVSQTGTMTVTKARTAAKATLIADSIDAGGTIEVNDLDLTAKLGGITLPQLSLTGTLSVDAEGAIDQSGAVSVGGTSSFRAAGALTLDHVDNDFVGKVALTNSTADDITIVDVNQLVLGDVLTSNNLIVRTGGQIDDDGTLNVGGTASFETRNDAGADILIDRGDASFGGLNARTLSAAASAAVDGLIKVRQAGEMRLGTIETTLDITLSADSIATIDRTSEIKGRNANLTATTGGVVLPSTTLSGNLEVDAVADVTQFSFVSSPGDSDRTTTLRIVGTTRVNTLGAISLVPTLLPENAFVVTNSFGGDVTLTAGSAASIAAGSDLQFAASSIGGDFQVTSLNDITQSGPLAVQGASSLQSLFADVDLGDAANQFNGPVSVFADGSTSSASVRSAGGLELEHVRSETSFTAIAGGAITDTGTESIEVTGLATFETRSDAAASIQLDGTANTLGQLVARSLDANATATASGDIDITQNGTMNIVEVRTQGAATLTAGGISGAGGGISEVSDLALTATTDGIALPDLDLAGSLTVNAAGIVSQTGTSLVVGGNTSITATDAVGLTGSDNRFSGPVTLDVTNGALATLISAQSIDLGASTLTGNLNVTANGAITDSGDLAVDGTASFISRSDSSAGITLDSTGSRFSGGISASSRNADGSAQGTGAIEIVTNNDLIVTAIGTDGDVTLSGNSLDLSGGGVSGVNNLTLSATGAALTLGGIDIRGTLTATALGTIGQTAALIIDGPANITSGQAAIQLGQFANIIGGPVSLNTSAGQNAEISVFGALDLGASDVGGDLVATSSDLGGSDLAAITDSGDLLVAGQASFETRSATAGDITLDQAGNSFASVGARTYDSSGLVAVDGDIRIDQTGAMTLLGIDTLGSVELNAESFNGQGAILAHGLTLNATNGPAVLPQLDLTGDLFVDAAGDISQTDNLGVDGDASFRGFNVLLDGAGSAAFNNIIGTLTFDTTGDALLSAIGELKLATSTIGADLTLTTTGNITQSAPIAVAGTSNFDPTGSATLTDTGNDFTGAVSATSSSGGNLVFADNNGFDLGDIDTDGNLEVLAFAAITDSGRVDVRGATRLETRSDAGADITLDTGTSILGQITFLTLDDAGNAAAAGDILFNGDATALISQIRTASTAFITSDAIDGTGGTVTEAAELRLTATAGDLVLPQLTLTGTLDATASGTIGQSGAASVLGAATFDAGSGGIALDASGNLFQGPVALGTTGNASLNNLSALQLADSSVDGDLALTTLGGITQTGPLSVGGGLSINNIGGAVTLDNPGNSFSKVGGSSLAGSGTGSPSPGTIGGFALAGPGDLELVSNTDILLDQLNVEGNLRVQASGRIDDSDRLSVVGSATFETRTGSTVDGSILLDEPLSTFGSVIARTLDSDGVAAVDADIDIFENGDMTIDGLNTAGDAQFTAENISGGSIDSVRDLSLTATGFDNNAGLVIPGNIVLPEAAIQGDLTADATGDISQSGPVQVGGTTNLFAPDGDVLLFLPDNDFQGPVNAEAQNVQLDDQNALLLGNIDASQSLSVGFGDGLSQSGPIVAPSLSLFGTGDAILNRSDNQIDMVTGEVAGSVRLRNSQDLVVEGGSSSSGLSASNGDLRLFVDGHLTLDGSLSASNATDQGFSLLLVTDGGLTNNAGAGALDPGSDRYLVYSPDPALDQRGALSGFGTLYHYDFDPEDPDASERPLLDGTPFPRSGDQFLYAIEPLLLVMVDNASRQYGLDNPSFTFTVDPSGLVDGDSASSALDFTALTSSATIGSNVGSYLIEFVDLSSPLNYELVVQPGALSITPAPLLISADDASRLVGTPNPDFTATFTGLRAGDSSADIAGLEFMTDATTASPPAHYDIFVGGAISSNYDISFEPGLLRVLPLPTPPEPVPGPDLDIGPGLAGPLDSSEPQVAFDPEERSETGGDRAGSVTDPTNDGLVEFAEYDLAAADNDYDPPSYAGYDEQGDLLFSNAGNPSLWGPEQFGDEHGDDDEPEETP